MKTFKTNKITGCGEQAPKTLLASNCVRLVAALVCFLALILAPSIGSAETISYSADFTNSSTNWDQIVNIPMFNPVLGTLQSVSITLTGQLQGLAAAENTKKSGQASMKFDFNLNEAISAPNGTLLAQLSSSNKWTIQEKLDNFDGKIDYAGDSGFTQKETFAAQSDSFVSSLASVLAEFTGTGSIGLTASGDSSIKITGQEPQVLVDASATASGSIGVSYGYSPAAAGSDLIGSSVPELDSGLLVSAIIILAGGTFIMTAQGRTKSARRPAFALIRVA